MVQPNAELLERARQAQAKLASQFLDHPDVVLIDIGFASTDASAPEQLALRIHVRERWFNTKPEERVGFPNDVDGILVVVIPGDYRPQT